jgi:hypothetical protein
MALVPPPPPLSIEEIEHLSELELRIRVSQWFEHLEVCGNDQKAGAVAQAEFYMLELERRKNAEVAARDYTIAEEDRRTNAGIAARDVKMATRSERMEAWVIILIGLEIVIALIGLWYGVHEGTKQQIVLERMGDNTSDTARILSGQKEVLGKMNTNTHDTVDAVGKLQGVQNDSLAAQKETLGSVGKMNKALQQQLDLAFVVSITVTADQTEKRLLVTNQTKTSIHIWGAQFASDAPRKFTDGERFVGPGSGFFFTSEKLFDDPHTVIPKGSPTRQVPFEFYLLSADGKPWIAKCFLLEVWERDEMKIYSNMTSVKQEEWPSGVR